MSAADPDYAAIQRLLIKSAGQVAASKSLLERANRPSPLAAGRVGVALVALAVVALTAGHLLRHYRTPAAELEWWRYAWMLGSSVLIVVLAGVLQRRRQTAMWKRAVMLLVAVAVSVGGDVALDSLARSSLRL